MTVRIARLVRQVAEIEVRPAGLSERGVGAYVQAQLEKPGLCIFPMEFQNESLRSRPTVIEVRP